MDHWNSDSNSGWGIHNAARFQPAAATTPEQFVAVGDQIVTNPHFVPPPAPPERNGRLVGLLAVSSVMVLIIGIYNIVRVGRDQGWFGSQKLSDTDIHRTGTGINSDPSVLDFLIVAGPALLAIACLIALAAWSQYLGTLKRKLLTVVSIAAVLLVAAVYLGRGGAILLPRAYTDETVSFVPLSGVAGGLQVVAGLILLIASLVAASPRPRH